MNTITYSDIMDLHPCYDPAELGLITRDWSGTILDVLRFERVSIDDRMWVAMCDGVVPLVAMVEFGLIFAGEALRNSTGVGVQAKDAYLDMLIWVDADGQPDYASHELIAVAARHDHALDTYKTTIAAVSSVAYKSTSTNEAVLIQMKRANHVLWALAMIEDAIVQQEGHFIYHALQHSKIVVGENPNWGRRHIDTLIDIIEKRG